jgi:DNA-directed RNA polymerase I subunit RPA49
MRAERMHFKRVISSLDSSTNSDHDKHPEMQTDYRTAQIALGEAFGTKKKRQAIHSLEKNQIDMARLHATSADYLNRAIGETIESRIGTSSAGTVVGGLVDDGIVPPYNLAAERVEECFPLDAMISAELQAALYDYPDRASFIDSVQPGPFVKSVLTQDNMKTALLFTILARLYPLKEAAFNDHKATAPLLYHHAPPPPPPSHHPTILSHFSDPVTTTTGKTRYKLPAAKKDKLALWCCGLALHLAGFRVDVTVVAAELAGATVTRVVQYFKALGCVVSETASVGGTGVGGKKGRCKSAYLSVPLTFPKARRQ